LKARIDPSSEIKVSHRQARAALLALANPDKARLLAGFFKTGRGQYAAGDRFLGVVVPSIRRLARQFRPLGWPDCERLLQSPHNEARLLALLILVERYQNGDDIAQNRVYRLYLRNRRRVNNWNLVDSSASSIVGGHLFARDRSVLYKLAQSRSLWDRRIAIIATFAFIRANDFTDTLELSRRLLNDKHDLMHKACGWMLREVGKRNQSVLENFLLQHHRVMPRTMLRYAIERFTPARRAAFLRQPSIRQAGRI
jgi:3-methyladenine DNA glycosylase AlkD